MNVLINTCSQDFLLVFFDKGSVIDVDFKASLVKKSDYLPRAFSELLKRSDLSPTDIRRIFVIKGYGSFMGARAGLLFAKTLAQVLKIKLYTAVYEDFATLHAATITAGHLPADWDRIISTFSHVKDVVSEETSYDKSPRIG